MADIENRYYQVASDGVDTQPATVGRWSKMGTVLIGGSSLVLFSLCTFMVSSSATSTLQSTSAAESTSLIGMSPFLRSKPVGASCPAMLPIGGNSRDLSTLARFALKQVDTNQIGAVGGKIRDISMRSQMNELEEIQAERDLADRMKAKEDAASKLNVTDMAGIAAPTGLFDPLGFSTDCDTGRLLFYREVELKHGRLAMLASLGILVGENFHPLFGGDIDVPAYVAFQQTPLQKFWLTVLAAIGVLEIPSVGHFESPFGMNIVDNLWKIKKDHQSGDFGFDPLGLKPTNPAEFKEMQTKELNNGRLAMIAAAGMIAQEIATGQKLF
eukprot:gnl/MRDRNA2_/MRDRNA2_59978_c0_seq1.p1 gnl/MRDRNA2_/MRDRNA2_59978_c0~~gnl/MRDRNA2_/MRDRNA2_59978_c0_seq1.p1  ORF type:complete len:352 (+),score=62.63 gnl/MRDRNA2_/MRDRNA2_59978_c0_seq1:78-1058(+)